MCLMRLLCVEENFLSGFELNFLGMILGCSYTKVVESVPVSCIL